ncbi:hypothetical protein DL93DRAFT_2174684 [Clavulina sp. PMI_390]|nr:hypothetical protein DL93DRAFT_2174684 [Clavulina sp. PMI_390]
MSLLRSVLKKNGEKREAGGTASETPFNPGKPGSGLKKNYARSFASSSMRSIKSSAASFKSVATTIVSVVSFNSFIMGGNKIPKRRRPDPLKFGAPTFYHRKPPPPDSIPGVERVPATPAPFTGAHSYPDLRQGRVGEPTLCVVLYSHSRGNGPKPIYHDNGVVSGEVRMFLDKPKAFHAIFVWFAAKMDCNLEIQGPAIIHQKAEILLSSRLGEKSLNPFMKKDKLPAGTHIFPFSFEPFQDDIKIRLNEEAERKNKGHARLPLPRKLSQSKRPDPS